MPLPPSHFTCPIGPLAQVVQHLSGFRHQQYPFGFAVRKLLGINRRRMAIAKVDFRTKLPGDSGGQRYLHPAMLNSVRIGANATHMSGMREHAPGDLLVLVPLLQEVIQTMVTDSAD